jgi:hypothetical protein
LPRSYLNTDILLNPVDYFHCPTALKCSLIFGITIFVLTSIHQDLEYEFLHLTCPPFHGFNSDLDIAVAHFRASRPGTQASKSEYRR